MNKKITIIVASIVLSTAILLTASENTHAALNFAEVTKKAMVQNMYNCYGTNMIKREIDSEGDIKAPKDLIQLRVDTDNDPSTPEEVLDDKDERPLPSGHAFTSIKDETLTCAQTLNGYSGQGGSITGVFDQTGHPLPSTGKDDWLMKYAGYEQSNDSSRKCISFTFSLIDASSSASTTKDTDKLCADIDSNGVITGAPTTSNGGGYRNNINGLNTIRPSVSSKEIIVYAGTTGTEDRPIINQIKISYANKKWETVTEELMEALGAQKNPFFSFSQPTTIGNTTYKQARLVGSVLSGSSFRKKSNAHRTATAAVYGSDKYTITPEEKVQIYQYYLTDLFNGVVECDNVDSSVAAANGYSPIRWFKTGDTDVTKEGCYVTSHSSTRTLGNDVSDSTKVNGIDRGWFKLSNLTYDLLVGELNNMTIEKLSSAAGTSTTDEGESEERAPDCQTRAGALGWILCPLISTSADYIQKAYADLIEPFMSIDAVLFDTETNGGRALREIWGYFQSFANLAFVIIFLIVIFSQLTGVGIDNYGIKKILPQLIVGAILINLSFLICQLAVDLSNILGRAIGGLFNNMSGVIDDELNTISINLNQTEASAVPAFMNQAGGNLRIVAAIAGTLALGAFLAAGPVIIIPALCALISLAIGAFFLFALLAIRQAVAVILVIISPLAFAAYMLPNTKNLYKQWFNTFKGLLVAYPITSALVYGGEFVSKVLIVASAPGGDATTQRTITSLGIVLSAAVVSVAPIFYIPGAIRKSLSLLSGVTNAMLSQQRKLTAGASKGASDAIRNSRLQSRMTSGVNGKGQLTLRGHVQNMMPFRTRAGRARLAEARTKALNAASADRTNRRMLSSAGLAAASAGILNRAEAQLVDDEIANMATSTKNYNTNEMETQLRDLVKNEHLSSGDKVRVQALMKKLSQSGGDGNKRLANIIRHDEDPSTREKLVSDEAKKVMADYATSTDVANSLGDKDPTAALYLRDYLAEYTNSGFTDWTNEITAGRGKTNDRFVVEELLDDDQALMRANTENLKTAWGTGNLDAKRAKRILKNENIPKKNDQYRILTNIVNDKTGKKNPF